MIFKDLLTFEDVEPGIQKVSIDIDRLYDDDSERNVFQAKFDRFLDKAEKSNKGIVFWQKGDKLTYLTEALIPKKADSRQHSLLLLLGNPAPHSVLSKMFFSYEGDLSPEGRARDHRFWRVLEETGILKFRENASRFDNLNVQSRSESRKKELYDLSYSSSFRIGLATFFSLPTDASDKEWGGICGLRKLFGEKALRKIAKGEGERIQRLAMDFLYNNGSIFAFQKDAYSEIKSADTIVYSQDIAKRGKLIGYCYWNEPKVRLFGFPPTRVIQGYSELLRRLKEQILAES
jgi:hypothetical protein